MTGFISKASFINYSGDAIFSGKDAGCCLGRFKPKYRTDRRQAPKRIGILWGHKIRFEDVEKILNSEYSICLIPTGDGFFDEQKRPPGRCGHPDIPAHDIIPSFAPRPINWLFRLHKREQAAIEAIRGTPLDLTRKEKRAERKQIFYLGLKDKRFRWCRDYRLLVSSRCRPEDYSEIRIENGEARFGDIPTESIPWLAVIKRSPGAECGLFWGAYEITPLGVEMEIAPERQMDSFVRRWRANSVALCAGYMGRVTESELVFLITDALAMLADKKAQKKRAPRKKDRQELDDHDYLALRLEYKHRELAKLGGDPADGKNGKTALSRTRGRFNRAVSEVRKYGAMRQSILMLEHCIDHPNEYPARESWTDDCPPQWKYPERIKRRPGPSSPWVKWRLGFYLDSTG